MKSFTTATSISNEYPHLTRNQISREHASSKPSLFRSPNARRLSIMLPMPKDQGHRLDRLCKNAFVA